MMDKYFDAEIKVSRKVLSLFGIWPCTKKEINVYLRFAVTIIVMIGFCNIPQTVKLYESRGNIDEILDILTNCDLTIGLTVIKTLTLWFNREALDALVASMANDWKMVTSKAERMIMKKKAKFTFVTSIILFSVSELAATTFFILNIYNRIKESQLYKEEISQFNDSQRIRPLYLLGKFPYDVQSNRYYEITWIGQVISTLFAGTLFAGTDSFFIALVLHLCAQMEILRMRLKDSLSRATVSGQDYCRLDLSAIVQRHRHLLWFADSMENGFNLQFLVILLSSILIFCLTGYQIVMTFDQDVVPVFQLIFGAYYYLCFSSSLFVYCLVAMFLSTESTKLGETAYDSQWYQLSPPDAKLLIIIMIRTSRPVVLTAGKFVALSLQLYCSVMRTSVGYLTVLLAVTDS